MENQEAVELIEGYYKENHSELIRLYCYNYSIYTGSNPPFQKVDILYTKNNGINSGLDYCAPYQKGWTIAE